VKTKRKEGGIRKDSGALQAGALGEAAGIEPRTQLKGLLILTSSGCAATAHTAGAPARRVPYRNGVPEEFVDIRAYRPSTACGPPEACTRGKSYRCTGDSRGGLTPPSLGQLCLLDALNAVSNGFVSEMTGGLISPPFEIEVVVVIRRGGLLVEGHWVLQTFKF